MEEFIEREPNISELTDKQIINRLDLSSHLYLYSAFNNTNCNKALHNIEIGKLYQ